MFGRWAFSRCVGAPVFGRLAFSRYVGAPVRRHNASRAVPAAKPPPLSKLKAAISRMESNQGPGSSQAHGRPPQEEHSRGTAR